MKLKRLYERDAAGGVARNAEGVPKVTDVKVLHETKSGRQNFTPNFVTGGAAEGWLVLGDGKITIKSTDGDLVYVIKRQPGYYCCHCQKRLDDGSGQLTPEGTFGSRRHVDALHKSKKSPDPNNPSGYRKDNYFACDKEVN